MFRLKHRRKCRLTAFKQVLKLLTFITSNGSIHVRQCQLYDDGYNIDGRSQIKVHTEERTQVYSVLSSLAVTHPSTNHGRRCLALNTL